MLLGVELLVVVLELMVDVGGMFDMVGGCLVWFRLPLAVDQAELYGVAPSVLEAAFLHRCVCDDCEDGW